MIEKKTQAALTATQDKNRISNEFSELRDQIDIKDRKVNVLQRKARDLKRCVFLFSLFTKRGIIAGPSFGALPNESHCLTFNFPCSAFVCLVFRVWVHSRAKIPWEF